MFIAQFVKPLIKIKPPMVGAFSPNGLSDEPLTCGASSFMEHHTNLSLTDIEGEVWKTITGYEGIYEVSNMGRVKSLKREFDEYFESGVYYKTNSHYERMLAQSFTHNKYLIVGLCVKNQSKTHRVARLVADAFIPNPDNKETVNHKKGVKTDNRATELEWATQMENCHHAINTGLTKNRGEDAYQAKLKSEEVVKIFFSPETSLALGERYNVASSVIRKIKNREIWKTITDNLVR